MICPECEGTGEEPCTACDGSGNCHHCGEGPCPDCGGYCTQECAECGGDKEVEDDHE